MDDEFILSISAAYAQEESLSASENQKWRIRSSYKNGEIMNWRFQFGFDITADSITINEEEAKIVRELFKRFNAGETMEALVRDMNRRKIALPLGGKWTNGSMRRMLSSEKYVGDALLQKTFVNNHLEKKRYRNDGQFPKYYVSGTHEAIIDRETFQKAQKKLEEIKKITKGRKQTKGPFHGMLLCPKCGLNYSCVSNNGTVGYNCTTFIHQGKKYCHGKKIPLEILKHETASVLGMAAFDENVFRELVLHIIVTEPNHLVYIFKDGHEVERIWQDRSRSESWTPEMREQAHQRVTKRIEEGKNARTEYRAND